MFKSIEIKLKNELVNLTEKNALLKRKLDSIEDLDTAKAKAEADIKVLYPDMKEYIILF